MPETNDRRVPGALLSAVARDLGPVRPLASPARRALALLPLGITLMIGIPAFWSARDISGLASWPSWALSAIETAMGLLVVGAAFREAVPGRELSSRALLLLVGAASLCFLAINAASLVPVAPGTPLETVVGWIGECVGLATAFSIPALAVPAWLVSRGLPNRPALAGALCGLSVGLMANAGLRIFCWDPDLAHVLLAHGGAIALLVAVGAACAVVVERLKRPTHT